jgi:hypothetical protein
MKPDEFPAGTRTGWILVVIVLVALAALAAFIGVARHRVRIRSEALAQRLISEFHRRFNSTQQDDTVGGRYIDPARIRALRSDLGHFEDLKSCEVREYIEPPSLTAICVSHFEHGEASEKFMFKDYNGDYRLLAYSAVALRGEVSSKPNP